MVLVYSTSNAIWIQHLGVDPRPGLVASSHQSSSARNIITEHVHTSVYSGIYNLSQRCMVSCGQKYSLMIKCVLTQNDQSSSLYCIQFFSKMYFCVIYVYYRCQWLLINS